MTSDLMKRFSTKRRRATMLLMVVSVLALLFVIVTGFLGLARADRLAVNSLRSGDLVGQILDATNDLLRSQMRRQFADGGGKLLSGGRTGASPTKVVSGYAPADIPGAGKSAFQAALEIVHTWARGPAPMGRLELEVFQQTAVSSLSPRNEPRQPTIRSLLLDYAPGDFLFTDADARGNARRPFMDADGDGMPDAGFSAMSVLSDLVNGIAGTPVHTPSAGFNPSQMNPGNLAMTALWNRFNQMARYEISVRVVNHGGMVSLFSPTLPTGFFSLNRQFITGMFNWVSNDTDSSQPRILEFNDSALFDRIAASAAAVEPHFRRRGGTLPSFRDPNNRLDRGRVPDVLGDLEQNFRNTFVPKFFGTGKSDNWQLFNLATIPGRGGEWTAYRRAMSIDPVDFNSGGVSRRQAVEDHNGRHLVTTTSNGDNLALELTSSLPGITGPGIRSGQPKFYLGDIADAFDPTTGVFLGGGGAGTRVVARLAGYFNEMLSSYAGWSGGGTSSEVVKRLEQARMLAVNTVAFAAPRNPRTGFIDVVTYLPPPQAAGVDANKRFIGYGPQPFISEVIVHREYDPGPGEPDEPDYALAIELYNPNEPGPTSAGIDNDAHALALIQFAISLNASNPNLAYAPGNEWVQLSGDPRRPGRFPQTNPLSVFGRFRGRAFAVLTIDDGNGSLNGSWSTGNEITGLPIRFISTGGAQPQVSVKLWRQGVDAAGLPVWYLVDAMKVAEPSGPPEQEAWRDVYRDASAETYWGNVLNPPRWGVAVNLTREPESSGQEPTAPPTSHLRNPSPLPGSRFGPTVPLYTMNAMPASGARNQMFVHGTHRPASFPTVGFMLFVPRFAHTQEESVAGVGKREAMSVILEDQWQKKSYGFGTKRAPVDFGHMPVFDNTQKVRKETSPNSTEYFDPRAAGKIPWGMLVFDYFSTLDPAGPDENINTADDLDPNRVPGMINVNAAPWYVLAGLPMLVPENPRHVNQFASPAFWSRNAGILVGVDPSTQFERWNQVGMVTDPKTGINNNDGVWLRLGGQRAQAIAAYRDRIAYVPPLTSFYSGTETRNGATSAGIPAPVIVYRDENGGLVSGGPRYGRIRRDDVRVSGSAPTKRHFGFLSLGELLNVRGMDQHVTDPSVPRTAPRTYLADSSDYFKAVANLALLDTQFLTTRSHTFTIYVTVTDRENPQQSVRSQLTVDRSNLLPRAVFDPASGAYLGTLESDGLPEIIAQRRVGYHNARFDD